MNDDNKANKSVDKWLSELYGQRLIILVETGPQSNKYVQLLFNAKQFKEVSDAVAKQFTLVRGPDKEGHEVIDLISSVDEYDLPSEIQDIAL